MIFAITTLISALSISCIAAYFSIIGLATIFPGSTTSVVIMGSVLEIGKIIAALGTLGAILELLGITDVFDFDDDAKAQVMEVKEKIGKSIKETATDPSFLQEIFGIGINPGSYVAKEVYDRVK